MSVTVRISEATFTAQVIDLAQMYGYLVAHFRPALTAKGWRTAVSGDGKGFPDIVALRLSDARLLVAELKAEGGRCTNEQTEWLNRMRNAGVETHVWRPSQMEEIVRVLSRRGA